MKCAKQKVLATNERRRQAHISHAVEVIQFLYCKGAKHKRQRPCETLYFRA